MARLCRLIKTPPSAKPVSFVIDLARPTLGRIFTDPEIHHVPDCAITCAGGTCWIVPLSPPVTLSDDEKLDALRRLDQFRQWHSLDEQRYCLVCGKIINGRQIQISGGTRGNGGLRVSCPTERCNSIPMDWVLPTDEILAKVERDGAEERKPVLSNLVAQTNGAPSLANQERHSITSRLRNLAFHLKRHS